MTDEGGLEKVSPFEFYTMIYNNSLDPSRPVYTMVGYISYSYYELDGELFIQRTVSNGFIYYSNRYIHHTREEFFKHFKPLLRREKIKILKEKMNDGNNKT